MGNYSLTRSENLAGVVTRQNLYDLIATSSLAGSGAGESAGVNITAVSLAPAVPSNGNTWWWDMSNQLLKLPLNAIGNSACSLWLSIGPDSWEIPLLNTTDQTLPKGCVMSFSEDAGAGFYAAKPTPPVAPAADTVIGFFNALSISAAHRGVCGVLQATAVAGQIVPAVYQGNCYARIEGISGIVGDNTRALAAAMATNSTGMFVAYPLSGGAIDYRIMDIGAVLCHPTPNSVCGDGILLPCFIQLPWNNGAYIATSINSAV